MHRDCFEPDLIFYRSSKPDDWKTPEKKGEKVKKITSLKLQYLAFGHHAEHVPRTSTSLDVVHALESLHVLYM